jgi:myo-inositol-1(or 4)-monophosphatase
VAASASAADIIRRGAETRGSLTWERKGATDFVSDVDRNAERAINEIVASRHPEARVLGEELTPSTENRSGLVFVADPLDGTTNFLHGYPWYAVSIAALVDGEPVAGVILNAATGELFSATAGGGARRSGQPIRVSTIDDPALAIIGTGFRSDSASVDRTCSRFRRDARRRGNSARRLAALDLADVACGRFDGFWELVGAGTSPRAFCWCGGGRRRDGRSGPRRR